jgi:hypothetical protein
LIYLGRSDGSHRAIAVSLLGPLLALFLAEIGGVVRAADIKSPTCLRLFFCGTVMFVITGVSLLGTVSPFQFLQNGWRSLETQVSKSAFPRKSPREDRLGDLAVSANERMTLEAVVSAVQRVIPEEGFFFDMSSDSSYYFFVHRRNPTRYPLSDLIFGPERVAEVVNQLSMRLPAGILIKREGGKVVASTERLVRNDALLAFVQETYVPAENIGPYCLMVPAKKTLR